MCLKARVVVCRAESGAEKLHVFGGPLTVKWTQFFQGRVLQTGERSSVRDWWKHTPVL
jgi:hypothetical protein